MWDTVRKLVAEIISDAKLGMVGKMLGAFGLLMLVLAIIYLEVNFGLYAGFVNPVY